MVITGIRLDGSCRVPSRPFGGALSFSQPQSTLGYLERKALLSVLSPHLCGEVVAGYTYYASLYLDLGNGASPDMPSFEDDDNDIFVLANG